MKKSDEKTTVYSLEKVSVYVDNNNLSKYYVDIDEAIERVKKQNIFGITDKVN